MPNSKAQGKKKGNAPSNLYNLDNNYLFKQTKLVDIVDI